MARRLGSGTQGITTRFRGHTGVLKSFLPWLSSLHGRGQERRGQGRGCEELGYWSGEVRTERN